ncbi:classical arabinogalactan protein 25-like [Morus notabilis]|uniref:classical arabinogalactan protein 25-like n=1 Tax=Morus notabilis TaxID=981085 RepID=UPI000CED32D5|nr:classical arabinogalactan protein 25-like [Morus notabilis]
MASFWFHLVLIMAFSALPSLSLSSQLNSKASTLPSSPPMLFTNPPPSFQELSPEITPLLPSPGGVVPTPTSSSVSTIPSNPSPPNPDDFAALGPAFSPFGSMQAVSTAPTRGLLNSSYLAAFACLAAYVWLCATP